MIKKVKWFSISVVSQVCNYGKMSICSLFSGKIHELLYSFLADIWITEFSSFVPSLTCGLNCYRVIRIAHNAYNSVILRFLWDNQCSARTHFLKLDSLDAHHQELQSTTQQHRANIIMISCSFTFHFTNMLTLLTFAAQFCRNMDSLNHICHKTVLPKPSSSHILNISSEPSSHR